MAFGDREGLHVMDMRSNSSRLICDMKGKAIGATRFSPDNGKLAFNAVIYDDPVFGDLYVVDLRQGATPVNLTQSGGDEILSVAAFSPDGSYIAYTTWGTLYVRDVEGAGLVEVQKHFSYWTDGPVFTNDGNCIIYSSDRGNVHQGSEIYMTDIAEGAEESAVKLTEARQYGLKSVLSPALGPDGNTIYFLGETYTGLVHLYTMPISGGRFTMMAPCVSAKDMIVRLTFVSQ
jgi:Tol biopolymer transport system component